MAKAILFLSAQGIAQHKTQSDTLVFERIFGCSCCRDTLHSFKGKSIVYVLTKNKTGLSAYKAGKLKWRLSASDAFGFNDAQINCMDLYLAGKQIVIRLFTDKAHGHVDIKPKNGHIIHYKKMIALYLSQRYDTPAFSTPHFNNFLCLLRPAKEGEYC